MSTNDPAELRAARGLEPEPAETCRCGDVLPASEMVDTPKGRMCRNCEAGLPDGAAAEEATREHDAMALLEKLNTEGKLEQFITLFNRPLKRPSDTTELDALRKRVAELTAAREREFASVQQLNDENQKLHFQLATANVEMEAMAHRNAIEVADLKDQLAAKDAECARLREQYDNILALFPDDEPCRHQETGVSVIDSIRDLLRDCAYWKRQAKDGERKDKLAGRACELMCSLFNIDGIKILGAADNDEDTAFEIGLKIIAKRLKEKESDLAAVTAHNRAMREALDSVLASDVSRRRFDALKLADAREQAEKALALTLSAALAKRDADVAEKAYRDGVADCMQFNGISNSRWKDGNQLWMDSATRRETGGVK